MQIVGFIICISRTIAWYRNKIKVRMDLKKIWWEGLDWINMAPVRDWGLAVVNLKMNVCKVKHQLVAQLFLFVN